MAISVLRGLAGKVIDLTANVFGVLPIANGGTGASDIVTARSNLGLKTAATYDVGTADNNIPVFDVASGIGKTGLGRYAYNLGSGFDLNGLNPNNGFLTGFYMGATFGNAPNNSSQWFFIELICHNAQYMVQKAFAFTDTGCATYVRSCVGSTWNGWYEVAKTNSSPIFSAIQAGSASYKKGWRKLPATLPSSAGEVTIAHGITTVEHIKGKVIDSDGLIVFNNDPDPARQFYIRVNGANLVLGVGSSATKIFGKTVTIYAGEEL